MNELEVRLYCLVLYNISPIQQGIQALHASLDYTDKYKDTEMFKRYMECKTCIILNGGTSNQDPLNKGTMESHRDVLLENGIDIEVFHEPDLNNALTAIAFLVDERVFNKEKYPDLIPTDEFISYNELLSTWKENIGGDKNVFLREFLKGFKLA